MRSLVIPANGDQSSGGKTSTENPKNPWQKLVESMAKMLFPKTVKK